MDDIDLEELSEELLQHAADCIESSDEDSALTVDYVDGVLSVELPDGEQLELSQMRSGQYLALQSPLSGATNFSYDETSEEWRDDEDNGLFETLSYEIKELADITVSFD